MQQENEEFHKETLRLRQEADAQRQQVEAQRLQDEARRQQYEAQRQETIRMRQELEAKLALAFKGLVASGQTPEQAAALLGIDPADQRVQ